MNAKFLTLSGLFCVVLFTSSAGRAQSAPRRRYEPLNLPTFSGTGARSTTALDEATRNSKPMPVAKNAKARVSNRVTANPNVASSRVESLPAGWLRIAPVGEKFTFMMPGVAVHNGARSSRANEQTDIYAYRSFEEGMGMTITSMPRAMFRDKYGNPLSETQIESRMQEFWRDSRQGSNERADMQIALKLENSGTDASGVRFWHYRMNLNMRGEGISTYVRYYLTSTNVYIVSASGVAAQQTTLRRFVESFRIGALNTVALNQNVTELTQDR